MITPGSRRREDRPTRPGEAHLPIQLFRGKPFPEDHPGIAPNFAAKAAARFEQLRAARLVPTK